MIRLKKIEKEMAKKMKKKKKKGKKSEGAYDFGKVFNSMKPFKNLFVFAKNYFVSVFSLKFHVQQTAHGSLNNWLHDWWDG